MDFDLAHFSAQLVQSMPDAVVYADAGGKIRFWNSGAERIFGYAESETLGQTLDIIIPENLRRRHWDGFESTMRSGESHYGAGALLAVPAVRKDGARISVEFTIVLFRGESARMGGIAAVMRDVTTQFAELRALRKQLAARGPS